MNARLEQAEMLTQFLVTRSPDLREQLVINSTPLVHFVLGRMGMTSEMGPDYEDLTSQGLMGLIEAVDRYQTGYGTQFSTYAVIRIRGRVLDYIRSQDFFSRKIRRQIKDVQKAVNELVIKNQQMPTDEEIAVYLNTSVPLVQKALQDASHVMMSLDTYTEQDGENDGFRYEMMIDENQPDPSNIFEEHDLKYRLVEAIRMLPEREQLVLSLYYYEELTLKEIGAVLKISESRVCQLHARSMMSMKALLQNQDAPSMHEEQV